MLEDNETLDAVFNFLAQIDLPTGLTALEDERHAFVDIHEMPSVRPVNESMGTRSPSSSEDSAPPIKAETAQKPKRTRISRKQQIDTLRGEVYELNEQLQSLLPRWQTDGQLVPRPGSMWQEIAARQFESREKSEEENAKLREMVQIQIHEARNLRRVLKRRTKIEMMEDMLGMKRQKLLDYGIPEDNSQVFDEMLQDTDELYAGIDALFHEKRLYELPCPGRRRDAKRNVTNGLFLKLTQRHMLPFNLQTTEKALWKSKHQIILHRLESVEDFTQRVRFHANHIEESSNTIKISFFADTFSLSDVKGAQFRMVVRKYVEKDRVVFICKILMQLVLHDRRLFSGFHTQTTFRIVVREDNSAASRVTLVDSHFSATRYDEGLPGTRVVRTPANLDIGIAAWDEAIYRIARQVESLAMDDSCSKLSSPVR